MYIHAQHIMALKHTYAHAQSSHTCSLGNFVIEGRTSGQQAGYQVATLVSTLVIAIGGGLLSGKQTQKFIYH